MSEGFTASNGWRLDDKGCLRSPNGTLYASSSIVSHLRRFLLEERDHALGRWRDPERQEYVVYPMPDVDDAWVVNEPTGAATRWSRGLADVGFPSGQVAARFFAAHPVKTVPTEPGYYMRRADVGKYAPDLWSRGSGSTDDWSTDASGEWERCDVSDLPADLVRLVPEEAQ